MAKKFYITTPIYYVNARPHIGTSYTTIIADIIARYKRQQGYDVRLTTGSDEHSQKMIAPAEKEGLTPLEFCDRMVPVFKEAWKGLNISPYTFVRTSDQAHEETVKSFFTRIFERGDIYKGIYEGYYCLPCETFWSESQLKGEKLCPSCERPTQLVKEDAYFFRLSKYQDRLLKHFEDNPQFVEPETARNEMLNRLKEGLRDLCISRSSSQWGIRIPQDENHIFYVWVDALLAYLTGSGYKFGQESDHYWPPDVNLIGRDITWFHAIIFPAMLFSADMEPAHQIFVHGFWNQGEGGKISKSKGNVVDPLELIKLVKNDGLRFFFAREIPLGVDGTYSIDALVNRYNFDLANDLGNLFHRTQNLSHKLFGGKVPSASDSTGLFEEIRDLKAAVIKSVEEQNERFNFSASTNAVWGLVGYLNRLIDEKRPWELSQKPERREEIEAIFNAVYDSFKTILALLYPIIPSSAQMLWENIGLKGSLEEIPYRQAIGDYVQESQLRMGDPAFPRIDVKSLL